MKTLQRIIILFAAAFLVSLITWAVVTVVTVASLPTDTMDYYPSMPGFHIDLGLSSLGIFESLVPITLIVVIEQVIEKWINRQKKQHCFCMTIGKNADNDKPAAEGFAADINFPSGNINAV